VGQLLFMLIFGALGAAVGCTRLAGGPRGFFYGALLGPLGVLIVALARQDEPG
jgi:hypothetical protein